LGGRYYTYTTYSSRILPSQVYFNIHFTVLDQPMTLPTIAQTPVGPIIEGNKVTLTCTIQGGIPVATITWSCDGATQINPTGSPSTVAAISSERPQALQSLYNITPDLTYL
jgi:hypothetical protein